MECRLDDLTFDIAAAAGWYSSIAGLLAGFALLAILLPLDHEAESDDDRSSEPVVVMTCAFFSLLLLSFSYAILSGRTGEASQPLAAHEQLLLGSSVGLSSLLLLFALYALLATYGRNRMVFRTARRVILMTTAVLGPFVIIALQFSNALDVERVRLVAADSPECGFGGMPAGVWINLAITGVGFASIGALALLRGRIPPKPGAAGALAIGVLVYTVLIVGWSSIVLPLLPVDVVTSSAFEHIALLVTSGATVVVSATAWSGR